MRFKSLHLCEFKVLPPWTRAQEKKNHMNLLLIVEIFGQRASKMILCFWQIEAADSMLLVVLYRRKVHHRTPVCR